MPRTPTIEECNELLPPEGHPYVGYVMFGYLSEVMEDKEAHGLIEKWNRGAELTRNKHWKQKSGKPGLVSANLLHAHRTRTVNMLTDNNPTFNVSRLGAADDEFTDKVMRLAEFWWGDQEQQSILEKSVGNGEEAGACVEKAFFDPDLEMGGEVEILPLSLFNVGVIPVDSTDPKKVDAWLHYYPMDLNAARRKWPDKADEIQGDEDVLKEIGDMRREIAAAGLSKEGYTSTYTPSSVQGFKFTWPFNFLSSVAGIKKMLNKAGTGGEPNKVLICEMWVRDHTMVEVGEPRLNEKGDLVQEMAPKYTGKIRMVQACNAGKLVLADRDNPSINPNIPKEQAIYSYLYDKFPFNMAQSVTDTVSIWGLSDYEQLEQLNIEVDKTISQLTVLKDKQSRCKVINPKDSGVPDDHFTNTPGVLSPSNSLVAQGIRYMEGPGIPAELITTLEIYKDLFFTVSGSFDMEQAKNQGREVIAYKAIAALLERASTMMKGKIRNYSKLIRNRGRMFISLAQNWYTDERWITYDDGGVEQSMLIVGPELLFPAKISVVTGSTMPRAKVQEREEAIGLFHDGAIDHEELYRCLDWPNRKALLKRMQQGPLSSLLDKLEALNTPAELLEIISGIANMDDKQFKKEIKSGEVPDMGQVLMQLVTGQPMQNPAQDKQIIENRKTQSEIALILEKMRTERVNQFVALAGVEFDAEVVNQNWAKISALIEDQESKNLISAVDAGTKLGQAATYEEKGMKSNNKEQ